MSEPPTPKAPRSEPPTLEATMSEPPTLEATICEAPTLDVVEDIVVHTESMEKRYTLKELRVMCNERNLSDKGNKSDLVQRLETA